jgi:hypothetical protein
MLNVAVTVKPKRAVTSRQFRKGMQMQSAGLVNSPHRNPELYLISSPQVVLSYSRAGPQKWREDGPCALSAMR